jgi:hypothetical protein
LNFLPIFLRVLQGVPGPSGDPGPQGKPGLRVSHIFKTEILANNILNVSPRTDEENIEGVECERRFACFRPE